MNPAPQRCAAEWLVRDHGGHKDHPRTCYQLVEPTEEEVAAAAPLLSRWYNEPRNRELLGNLRDLSAAEVAAHYAGLRAEGGRPFHFLRDGALVGDGDLRNFGSGSAGAQAEYALLVGESGAQGRGLGTRFSLLVLHFAFEGLKLARVWASVSPENQASLRLFARLGFTAEASSESAPFADEPDDVILRLDAAQFSALHGAQAAAIQLHTGQR
jgi:RimJ/RimL family protein N-acetyltransferase